MKKSSATLRGIVVAGDSRQEVENHYRAVATGLSVKALQDQEENFVILSNADSELSLMNPLTGDMNLVEASDLNTDDFEFLASGEDETVNVFYTLCSDGCGSHVIADDAELMERCPVCASELQDLNADDIAGIEQELAEASDDSDDSDASDDSDVSEASDEQEDDSDEQGEPSMITVASSKEDAVEAFRALAEGESDPSAFDCEAGIVVTASGSTFEYSPFTGEAATAAGDIESFNVEASSDGEYDAHYYMCASDECGSHVVSSSEEPVFCPVCASGLIEPEVADEEEEEPVEATASDDEDDEEDDDLLDGLLDDEDEDEDEDDEATASASGEATASDDEDDEEDDEEDEDDEDDEEEDDEDEDFDDKNSMSVSSVTVQDEEPVQLESVSTNLLALATASAGELTQDHLDVAFAGELAGTPTWLAMYNGQIVATATQETASVEAQVFNSDVYGNLVHASAKENGVSAALNELGFRPIEATVNVDAYIQEEVASRVEAGVSSVRDNFEQSSSDYAARFEAALATAATGVNKNFFEDVKNPIKAALASTMNSVGVRNADRLVAQAFAKHNDDYLKGLVAKACEIMDYDVSVQNQLTKAVASASNEQTVTASGSGSDLAIGRPVESNAEQARQEQPRQEATASASKKPQANLDAVLSSLGRRNRT